MYIEYGLRLSSPLYNNGKFDITSGLNGWGELDPGACGYELKEYERALAVGNRVMYYLQQVRYEVELYQKDGLADIVRNADASKANIFVSIHCNAANGSARGTETYCYYGANQGRQLATYIHNQLIDRGVREAGFYVIKYTSMPAVLCELAFIDNYNDAQLLINEEDNMARAIARGITDYFTKL